VLRRWAPLAASWVLMTGELVAVAAVVARLPDPEVQLAAWGVVFVVSIVIQAPSSALLPASTALATTRAALARLGVYAAVVLAALTGVHALLALTPLYGLLLGDVMRLPPEVMAAAHWPLVAMIPWSFGTGTRRLLHGPLIRVGFGRVVILGALVRLGTGLTVLLLGVAPWPPLAALRPEAPGALLAALAVIGGVLAELAFVRWRAAVVLPRHLPAGTDPEGVPLRASVVSARRFSAFYTPLMLTALLTMLVQTLVTSVMGRMPRPLESLAVWPVVTSFLQLWQGPAYGYTEAVISLHARRGGEVILRRMMVVLAAAFTVAFVVSATTPLARLWFVGVMGLPPGLVETALVATLWAVAVPGLRIVHSTFQGILVVTGQTRVVLESVIVFLVVVAAALAVAVASGAMTGASAGTLATALGLAAQSLWMIVRTRAAATPAAAASGATPPGGDP
jgi:hypothetical protein